MHQNSAQHNLKAFDESVAKFEADINTLTNDLVTLRSQMTKELFDAQQAVKDTRDDYIQRMNAVYGDQTHLVEMFNENNKQLQEALEAEHSRASEMMAKMRKMLVSMNEKSEKNGKEI